MNTRLGSRVAALLAFIIVAAGCVSSADPPATSAPPATAAAATTSTLPLPPTFASGSLVTEDELILHAAEATARDGSLLFAGMLSGGNPAMVICNQDDPSAGWNDGRTLSLTLRFNSDHPECPDPQYEGHPIGELTFHWTFGSAVYADGEVDVGDCRKLPGAGTVTTGEYRELTNETSDPIERTISHTVEESHSSETSLSETLDLTTGQSIEAGGGAYPASARAKRRFRSSSISASSMVRSNRRRRRIPRRSRTSPRSSPIRSSAPRSRSTTASRSARSTFTRPSIGRQSICECGGIAAATSAVSRTSSKITE